MTITDDFENTEYRNKIASIVTLIKLSLADEKINVKESKF